MLKRFNIYSDDMTLALAAWLCSLPFIGLLIVPVWGFKTAGLFALIVLIAVMVFCWGVCGWKLFKR